MKKSLILAALFFTSWTGQALAQDASGTVTTELTIEPSCVMGTDAVTFSETFPEGHNQEWAPAAKNLTFACSTGNRYRIFVYRVSGINDSVELVSTSGETIPYTITIAGVEIASSTTEQVEAGITGGLNSFLNIEAALSVAGSAIAGASPDTYTNIVNVEIFLN
jgi:hypothetical protein